MSAQVIPFPSTRKVVVVPIRTTIEGVEAALAEHRRDGPHFLPGALVRFKESGVIGTVVHIQQNLVSFNGAPLLVWKYWIAVCGTTFGAYYADALEPIDDRKPT
jgi:hypothetical protein